MSLLKGHKFPFLGPFHFSSRMQLYSTVFVTVLKLPNHIQNTSRFFFSKYSAVLWCVASGLLCSFVCLGWVRCLEFLWRAATYPAMCVQDLPNVRTMLGSSSASADTWRPHFTAFLCYFFTWTQQKGHRMSLEIHNNRKQLEIVSLQGAFKSVGLVSFDTDCNLHPHILIKIWNIVKCRMETPRCKSLFKMHIKIMPCLLEVDTFFICKKTLEKRETVASPMVKLCLLYCFVPVSLEMMKTQFYLQIVLMILWFLQPNIIIQTWLWQHFCKIVLCCFLHVSRHFKSEVSSEWHKSAEAVLSKTDEHESGSVCYVGCFMYCGSWERKWVNGVKMLMLYHVWKVMYHLH